MNESNGSSFRQRLETLAGKLEERFADRGCELKSHLGEISMTVPAEQLIETARDLRDGEEFCFEELIDVCGIDYSDYGVSEWATGAASYTGFGRGVEQEIGAGSFTEHRFAVVYHLLSLSLNHRLRLRVYVDSVQPKVDSVIPIWNSANWFEREAFDLYGILFDGHPDLRRILTDYGFVGHPFRKDFPLGGQVEMRYDPERRRVVYEPVELEPRVLVPKVIRDDNRHLGEEPQPQDSADA